MTLPDNRIRFQSGKINFDTSVGTTGLDHDDYPQAGGQARFDHMRLYLIGLLSQQSSYDEPAERRDGTPWFDMNTLSLKIWKNSSWVNYADAIALTEPDTDGDVITLLDWYTSTQDLLSTLSQEIVFSGSCSNDGVTTITIPSSVVNYMYSDSRVFLHINGLLVDPHNCSVIGTPPTTIKLSNIELSSGDVFTVSIRRISSSTFVNSSVTV